MPVRSVIGRWGWAVGSSGWVAGMLMMPVAMAWSQMPGVFCVRVIRAPFFLMMSRLFMHWRRRWRLRLVAWVWLFVPLFVPVGTRWFVASSTEPSLAS